MSKTATKTTTSIKLDPKLKKDASALAKEMGLSLSTVVNATLTQYVRDRRLVLDTEPKLSPQKAQEHKQIRKDIKEGKNVVGPFTDVESLMKSLNN